MKKLILGLLLVVLFIPTLALARQDEDSKPPAPPNWAGTSTQTRELQKLAGDIVSVSKNEVTLASGTKDKPQQIKIRIPERRAELGELLAKGINRQSELLCHKTPQGDWVLLRIGSIEGVDVSSQPALGPQIREGLRRKAEQLSPEERERLRGRFTAMSEYFRENPQLREELKKLAKEDPEAFRQRIRQMHEQAGDSSWGPQQGQRRPMPSGQRMGPHGQGMGMSPKGQGMMGPQKTGGKPRFSPQMAEIHKLEQQTRELAERYRQAEGRQKDEPAEKLRVGLSEIFDKKAQAQSQEVQRLEKQLEELRGRIEKRRQNRETIIQKRFEQLTSQGEDELAW